MTEGFLTARLSRYRVILIAYAGMIVLLLLTGFVSPGFLTAVHLGSMSILASFIGIVALGQTFVIIGFVDDGDFYFTLYLRCARIWPSSQCDLRGN